MRRVLAILVLFILVLPLVVLAQGCPSEPCPQGLICIQNPLCAQDFGELIESILNFLFSITVVLAPVMLTVSGLLFLTAGGDPGRVQQAKNILLWSLVGFTIIFLSKGLIAVLESILGID